MAAWHSFWDWASEHQGTLAVLSVFLAVAVPLALDWLRRPRIRIEIGKENEDWPRRFGARMLRFRVSNRPYIDRLARGHFLRGATAQGCAVLVEFLDLERPPGKHHLVVSEEGSENERFSLYLRWDDSPQPADQRTWAGFEPLTRRRDVPPYDQDAYASFAFKGTNDWHAWLFNSWNYFRFHPRRPYRAPPVHKLPPGAHALDAIVSSGSRTVSERFILCSPEGQGNQGFELRSRSRWELWVERDLFGTRST